jgi:hypothetical protein
MAPPVISQWKTCNKNVSELKYKYGNLIKNIFKPKLFAADGFLKSK